MTTDTTAGRVDRAVEALLSGRPAVVEPSLRDVVAAAAVVRAAHPLLPPGTAFEERVAERLRQHSRLAGAAVLPRALAGIRSHPRLLAAAGSAAVSVAGVTAFAVWRAAHSGRAARS